MVLIVLDDADALMLLMVLMVPIVLMPTKRLC
jgi:hypothetical protein